MKIEDIHFLENNEVTVIISDTKTYYPFIVTKQEWIGILANI